MLSWHLGIFLGECRRIPRYVPVGEERPCATLLASLAVLQKELPHIYRYWRVDRSSIRVRTILTTRLSPEILEEVFGVVQKFAILKNSKRSAFDAVCLLLLKTEISWKSKKQMWSNKWYMYWDFLKKIIYVQKQFDSEKAEGLSVVLRFNIGKQCRHRSVLYVVTN